MADGQIIYQVRVDSSQVASDLGRAGEQIDSGALLIGEKMAALSFSLTDAISSVISPKTLGVTSFLSGVTTIAGRLNSAASLAAQAMQVLSENIVNTIKVDVPNVGSFFDKLTPVRYSGASEGKGGASKMLSRATTPSSYRSGSPYINKDEYAFLHKGEAVLTAAQNETLTRLGGIEAISALPREKTEPMVVQNNTPKTVLPEQNINVTVELDGHKMARVIASATNDMNRQLNTRIVK